MQVLYIFSRQNSETFDISHAFQPLTITKLWTLKNGPVFLAQPVFQLDYQTKKKYSAARRKLYPLWLFYINQTA